MANDLGPVHPVISAFHIRSEINSTVSVFAQFRFLISWVWNDSVLVTFFLGLPANILDLDGCAINIYRYIASVIFIGLLVGWGVLSSTSLMASSPVRIFLTLIPVPLLLRSRRHIISVVSIWTLRSTIFNVLDCMIQWIICVPIIISRCKILIKFEIRSFMFIS